MKILLTLLITGLQFTTMCSFAQQKSDLLGFWISYKKESRNGVQENTFGDRYTPISRLRFTEQKGEAFLLDHKEFDFDYAIIGDTLLVGQNKLIIEKLTAEELVLLDIDDFIPENPLVFRFYYRKKNDD